MGPLISRHHGCQTVSKAKLQKAFSALLMSQEPGALHAELIDPSCELEKSEFCSIHGIVKDLLSPQDGSAAGNIEKRTLRGFLAPEEWIRSHPVLTLALLSLLLFLVMVFGVSLAAMSGRTQTEIPVTPDTPQLLACPDGWVGYRGICYLLSEDHLTWDEAQAQCSELGASLAVLRDMDMEFVFRLSGKDDFWLGLRRQDQGLQWVDSSSFNSSVTVQGNAECVHVAENKLACGICSNSMQYICSRPQTRR